MSSATVPDPLGLAFLSPELERGKNPSLEDFVDDSAAGVFWGPSTRPKGEPIRWSRAWFDWRSEQGSRASD